MASPTAARERADVAAMPPHQALQALLDRLAELIVGLPPGTYTSRPVGATSGSIGQHVRHILDHVSALATARPDRTLSYDCRERGTVVEADPAAALREMLRLKCALDRWAERPLDEPVRVAALVASGRSVAGWSTRARELAFVVSHTIHHQAIVACLLAFQGCSAVERFGYAPSTPQQ